jgi:hypothetical protein
MNKYQHQQDLQHPYSLLLIQQRKLHQLFRALTECKQIIKIKNKIKIIKKTKKKKTSNKGKWN